MSDEIKSGTGSCKSTIEHETAGILRCESGHEPFLPYPDVHGCGGHGWGDSDPRIITAARPWRFDVPEVPPGVTAFEDGGGTVWIRIAEVDRWAKWQVEDAHLYALRELLVFGSLVECPDPRATT